MGQSRVLEIIEHRTWHVTWMGWFGSYPPPDAAGFWAFAKALRTPKRYDFIKDAARVADITAYRFPTSMRQHYEQLTIVPQGLLVLGDAIGSVNPFYGQGMSAAALQVQGLQQILRERADGAHGLNGLAGAFFQEEAAVVDRPWVLAAMRDFAYERGTRGTAGGPGRARAVFRRRGCPHGRRSRGPTAGDRGVQSGQAAFGLIRGTVAESSRGA